jgi:alpha-galactosidase
MIKIAIIGAGSIEFTRNLTNDIFLTPCLQDCKLALMDIDSRRLDQALNLVQSVVARRKLNIQIEASLDRRQAVTGADYVITTFQQGGLKAFASDVSIPQKYGVEQCIGDTLGPGGVFRALRTIPVLVDLCADLDAVAPDALLLNYVNPMAANCWAVDAITGRPHVGMCHSVQETSELLAEWAGVPYDEVSFLCAGINHFAFFLKLQQKTPQGSRDLYPAIWEAVRRPEALEREPVRIELMNAFGYFCTEASGHNSEYVPYFRKTPQVIEEELVPRFQDPSNHYWFDYGRTGGFLRYCIEREGLAQKDYEDLIAGVRDLPDRRTREYCAPLIESIETNTLFCMNGNIPNRGLITNLPQGSCVEVPCLVDGNGLQPTIVGELPPQCAGLLRTNVSVQEMIVEACRTGMVEAVHQAVALDPLTSAVCTLPQIHAMVDEMLCDQADWLPQFPQQG